MLSTLLILYAVVCEGPCNRVEQMYGGLEYEGMIYESTIHDRPALPVEALLCQDLDRSHRLGRHDAHSISLKQSSLIVLHCISIPPVCTISARTLVGQKTFKEEEYNMPGFEPKTKVELAPPKDDVLDLDYLAKCDGTHEGFPTLVAIKVGAMSSPYCASAGFRKGLRLGRVDLYREERPDQRDSVAAAMLE